MKFKCTKGMLFLKVETKWQASYNARPVSDTSGKIWTLFAECQFELVLFSSRNKRILPRCTDTHNKV